MRQLDPKYIALILRHKPPKELGMDSKGFVEINKLINFLNSEDIEADKQIIQYIVDTDDKNRYEIIDNKIRARQGHSIKQVNLEFDKVTPPNILYHGTKLSSLNSIKKTGLKALSRQYVHLSKSKSEAMRNASRWKEDKPVILEIKAKEMNDKGFDFFISTNEVYLTKSVPKEFIK